MFIDSITKLHANTTMEQAFAEIEAGKARRKLKFKIVTGAQANVLPGVMFYETFGEPTSGSPNSYISGHRGQKPQVKGSCRRTCRHKEKKTIMLDFDIVDVLGMRACLYLNIVKLVHTQPSWKSFADKSVSLNTREGADNGRKALKILRDKLLSSKTG